MLDMSFDALFHDALLSINRMDKFTRESNSKGKDKKECDTTCSATASRSYPSFFKASV